jgi:DNA repair protein RadC
LPTHVHSPEDALEVLDFFTAGVAWKQFIILILNADHRGRIAAVFDELGPDPQPVGTGIDTILLESSMAEGCYVILGSYRPGEDVDATEEDIEVWHDLVDCFAAHGLTVVDWFLLDEDRGCSVAAAVGTPWPW